MNAVLPLSKVGRKDRPKVGGKAISLALMAKEGMAVPPALCITTEAYNRFLDATGLRSQIIFELYRKPFNEMRWEEIWDTALRIRNLFAKTLIPADLSEAIEPFEFVSLLEGVAMVSTRRNRMLEDLAARIRANPELAACLKAKAERIHAEAMLDLARASYRLRDDDNIYLGKIEGQMLAALEEGKRRIAKRQDFDSGPLN